MSNLIKTNIKFYKGLDGVEDRFYGFVTKTNGSWKGCRETESKKKIVFVDSSLSKDVIPDALYKCTLRPMVNNNGFVAVSMKLVKFKPLIESVCKNEIYVVKVKFGNKTIIYDPTSKERRQKDIQVIAENLRNRNDLENAVTVAEDFVSAACIVKHLYEQSHVH